MGGLLERRDERLRRMACVSGMNGEEEIET